MKTKVFFIEVLRWAISQLLQFTFGRAHTYWLFCSPHYSYFVNLKFMQQNPQIEPNSFSSSNSHENSTLQDFIEMILLRSTMKHQPSMKRSKNRSVKWDRKKALSVNKVPTLMWFHAWNSQFWYTVKLWTATHLI